MRSQVVWRWIVSRGDAMLRSQGRRIRRRRLHLPDPVSSRSLDLRGRSWETPPLDRLEVLS